MVVVCGGGNGSVTVMAVVALVLAGLLANPLREARKLQLRASLLHQECASDFGPLASYDAGADRCSATSSSNGARRHREYVVGVNAAVDVIVSATSLLKALAISPTETGSSGKDHASIGSLEELESCFSHFFASGSASERPFTDKAIFDRIVTAAMALNDTELYIGGNAALIGDFIAGTPRRSSVEATVSMAALVGPVLDGLLPASISVADAFKHGAMDEYHIIMEYLRGETWGSTTAPRANRFIFSHDRTNAELRALEPWESLIKASNHGQGEGERVYVVSGVHMLEGEAEELQMSRIKKLADILNSMLAEGAAIHLELASLHTPQLMELAAANILPRVTSLGLNEQELAFYASTIGLKDFGDLSMDPHATTETILAILDTLPPNSSLSRVHFHTLNFHIIVAKEGLWGHSKASVAAGVLTCARRACEDERLDVTKFDLHTTRMAAEVSEVTRNGFVVTSSPALTCKRPVKTVGLGDSISAAGLQHTDYLG